MMRLVLIAAMNRRRVIGKDGAIPWHSADDLRHFKSVTLHHTLLMGRRTFESIGHALPDRRLLILSRTPHRSDSGEWFTSIDNALRTVPDGETVYVAGGGEIYAQTIGRAGGMLLSHFPSDEPGTVHFPDYEPMIGTHFTVVREEMRSGFTLREYRRISGS